MNYKKLFLTNNYSVTTTQLTLLTLLVYTVSLLLHLLLYFQVQDNSLFFYNDRIMPIWTDDAAHFGYVAKQILGGVDVGLTSNLLPYIVAYSSKFLGLHIDTVMYFLPALLASSISIPIFLLLSKFKLAPIAFFASILSTILPAYYMRTHLGYTDNDILVMPLVMFMLYGAIASSNSNKHIYPAIGSLSIFFLYLSYGAYLPIVALVITATLIYALLFKRGCVNLNRYILTTSITLAIVYVFKLNLFVTIFAISIVLLALNSINEQSLKKYGLKIVVMLLLIGALFLQDKIVTKIEQYSQRNDSNSFSTLQAENNQTLYFFDMFKTVEEAKSVNIDQIISFSAINKVAFYTSILGLILLTIRHRAFLIILIWSSAAFWMSYSSGIRFTYVLAPLLPIGFFYILYLVLQNRMIRNKVLKYSLFFMFVLVSIFTTYKVVEVMNNNNKLISPKYFTKEDLKLLDIINKHEVKENDYVLSWWDYGHMLKYYTNMKPYVDNGVHPNVDLYMISKMFMSPNQNLMYNGSKFLVDSVRNDSKRVSQIFRDGNYSSIIHDLYQEEYNLTKTDGNIFLYVPDELIRISATVRQFSARDLESQTVSDRFKNTIENGIIVDLKNPVGLPKEGINFNPDTGILTYGKDKVGVTAYREIKKNLQTVKMTYKRDKEYNYFAIKYKDRFFISGKLEFFDNFLFRLLFFDMYDPEKFEMLGRSNHSTILKLK
ncbi:MAG: hypothetical protein GQ570_01575 [Helicobacteraceae bacterium]|nr:hypothetical protein [Helicobacteraceae bacterium]